MAQQKQVTIPVHVIPSASKNKVTGILNEILYLGVTTPARDGRANTAVIALLAKALNLSKRDIAIVKGCTSRQKTVSIHRLSIQDLEAVLALQCNL